MASLAIEVVSCLINECFQKVVYDSIDKPVLANSLAASHETITASRLWWEEVALSISA